MKKLLLVFMFFVPVLLFAAIGDNGISVAPDGTLLKWEEGKWDFFIMHKSLLERSPENLTNSEAKNPQADTCMDPAVGSTYTLTSKHIPDDADIDRAFLIWLSAQDPDNLEGKTDNSVTLTFTNASDPTITLTKEVTASKQGNLATTQQGDFEYEALNVPGDSNTGPTGFYTYRVDVSGFMKEIIAKGATKGMKPGEALYGNYNVKGMDCSNHATYLKLSNLVGGWALPVIYKSSHVFAKKIYFYHGLESYHIQSNTIKVSGFQLPDEAYIKLGLVVFEGDPGLANSLYPSNPEGLRISSQQNPENFNLISNKCNPQKDSPLVYTEVFNSISSIYGWKDKEETCIGNPDDPLDPENPIEYAIDADMFLINTRTYPLNKDDTEFNIKIGANQDGIYTNFLIISVDTYRPEYDSDDPDAADSDSDDEYGSDIQPGEYTGPCYEDLTCDEGLVCENYTCVRDEYGDSNDTDSADDGDTDSADPADSDYSDYSDEYGSDIGPGEYTGECLPDNTCYEDLVCENHTCVYKSSGGCSLLTVD